MLFVFSSHGTASRGHSPRHAKKRLLPPEIGFGMAKMREDPSVPKYGNLKLHENFARHKAVMDAIEQKTSENAMLKHISVTPVSALISLI